MEITRKLDVFLGLYKYFYNFRFAIKEERYVSIEILSCMFYLRNKNMFLEKT